MAKNSGRGRKSSQIRREPVRNIWTVRNSSSGKFMQKEKAMSERLEWSTNVFGRECHVYLKYRGLEVKHFRMRLWPNFPMFSATVAMGRSAGWLLWNVRFVLAKMRAVDELKANGLEPPDGMEYDKQ